MSHAPVEPLICIGKNCGATGQANRLLNGRWYFMCDSCRVIFIEAFAKETLERLRKIRRHLLN